MCRHAKLQKKNEFHAPNSQIHLGRRAHRGRLHNADGLAMASDLFSASLASAEQDEAKARTAAAAQGQRNPGGRSYAPDATPEEIARTVRLNIKAWSILRYLIFVALFSVVALSTRDARYAYWYKRARRQRLQPPTTPRRLSPPARARAPTATATALGPSPLRRAAQADDAADRVHAAGHARRKDL